MKSILINISGKISETSVSVLREIDRVTQMMNLSFLVVGATARDIILEHHFEIQPQRATIDIDVGVLMAGWDQFNELKKELIRSTRFSASKQKQRLVYEDIIPVDIVPFGVIADENCSITWPPDHDVRMSTAGFQESYRNSISVKLSSNPELIVKVVSLAGLALLKFISWDDNPERQGKDASDLLLIMRHYLDAGNLKRMFNEEIEIVEAYNNDLDLVSAFLLGRDIAKISSPATKDKIIEIIERAANSKQGHKIALSAVQNDLFKRESYQDIVRQFNAFLEGLVE